MKLTLSQAKLLDFIIINGTTTSFAVKAAKLSFISARSLKNANIIHTSYAPSGIVTVWLTHQGKVIADQLIIRRSQMIKPVGYTNDQFLVTLLNDTIKDCKKFGLI
jgi:hypothetical protein